MKSITDWIDKKDNSNQYQVHMHINASCFGRWTSELITWYSMIRLLVCWHCDHIYELSLLEQEIEDNLLEEWGHPQMK